MGALHCRVLSKMSQVDKLIVIEVDEFKRIEAAQFSSKIVTYPSLSKCIANESSIHYLTICTPSSMHNQNIKDALGFNLNILVEKPFVTNISDGLQIINTHRGTKLLVGVGFVERYNSAVLKAKELIKSGAIGQVYEIHTKRWGGMPPTPDVGVLLDLASHDVDLCRFLLGSEYAQVSASVGGGIKSSSKQIEASAVICGISTNQTVISNSVSWRSTSKKREIAILGSKGSLELNTSISELKLLQQSKLSFDYENLKFLVGENPTITTIIDHPRIEPLHAEHLAFQEAIMNKSDNPNIVQMYDAIKSLKVLDAALESQSTNKIISIL
jgi:predicted dehydrogenase